MEIRKLESWTLRVCAVLLVLTLLTGCNPTTPPTSPPQTATEPPPLSTAIPSPTITEVPATATPLPSRTSTPGTTQPDQVRRIPSPDGRWTAVVNDTAGSLDLQGPGGDTCPIFPPDSTVTEVNWSPDVRHLLVVRSNWQRSQSGPETEVYGPIEIWRIRLEGGQVGLPSLVFQAPTQPDESGAFTPEQIVLGTWSPNNRYVLFWQGMLSASILADGLALWSLDTELGEATLLADTALLNSKYHNWAPDSAALVFTAGGYRSAQINKWLNLFDATSGQVTTVVSQTEQIPGIVAWSPRGDLIAYAAVPATETGPELTDWMVFDNPAIAGRRVYLLDPATGHHQRLNNADAFQDAPTWSDDGAILYYVQREDDVMVLMAADPATGQAQVIEGSQRPAPRAVGYYGQSNWDDLLAYRPEAPRAEIPPLTETYTDPTDGYTLHYPAGWYVGQGWQETPTLSSYPPDGPVPELGPFSGQALIAIQVVELPEGDLDALLDEVLASPGPGQILGRDRTLTAFDRRDLTVDGRPARRLETMGDFGVVNHVLVILEGTQGIILRGRGDGRVFDAVAGSLQLP
jgi:dipeptidyl aminopeptidase/acylaminoacyl peptidase